jgi:hypothetical protein
MRLVVTPGTILCCTVTSSPPLDAAVATRPFGPTAGCAVMSGRWCCGWPGARLPVFPQVIRDAARPILQADGAALGCLIASAESVGPRDGQLSKRRASQDTNVAAGQMEVLAVGPAFEPRPVCRSHNKFDPNFKITTCRGSRTFATIAQPSRGRRSRSRDLAARQLIMVSPSRSQGCRLPRIRVAGRRRGRRGRHRAWGGRRRWRRVWSRWPGRSIVRARARP